jgi:hypothetical protein
LAYADDVNLFGNNINSIKKYTETLIHASKEVGLEINVEETKYILLPSHQNAGPNRDMNIINGLFEDVSQFRYFGAPVTNHNLIQKQINACYPSV